MFATLANYYISIYLLIKLSSRFSRESEFRWSKVTTVIDNPGDRVRAPAVPVVVVPFAQVRRWR